jgi:hypothetical protein
MEAARTDPSVVVPELPHPAEYYQFSLRGVLVHTGTADSGHYYSFIKEPSRRRDDNDDNNNNDSHPNESTKNNNDDNEDGSDDDDDDNDDDEDNDTWHEFNDTHVSPFDARELPEHAFGGTQRMNNAYMLFYDRDAPPLLEQRVKDAEAWVRRVAARNEVRLQ